MNQKHSVPFRNGKSYVDYAAKNRLTQKRALSS